MDTIKGGCLAALFLRHIAVNASYSFIAGNARGEYRMRQTYKHGTVAREANHGMREIIRGLCVAVGMATSCVIVLTLAVYGAGWELSGQYLYYVIIAIHVISVVAGSIMAVRRVGGKGLWLGSSIGALYAIITLIIGLYVYHVPFNITKILLEAISCVLLGVLGAFIALNL